MPTTVYEDLINYSQLSEVITVIPAKISSASAAFVSAANTYTDTAIANSQLGGADVADGFRRRCHRFTGRYRHDKPAVGRYRI
ncbi:hypothetical protein FACS189499_03980 [Clostridia bacterium]|nr:hypothetical protein FACS189499_03980 [Clostridia bacterium]